MRFRTLHLIGFTFLILLTFLFFGRQSLLSVLTMSIVYSLIVILQLILSLLEDELSSVHVATTAVLFLSLGYLFVHLMGPSTITTFFLGGMFILAYLAIMFLIFIADWKKYHIFDRMILAMQERKEHAKEHRELKASTAYASKQKKASSKPSKHAFQNTSHKNQDAQFVPVDAVLQEPPHFRVRQDDDGEWIELKVKKARKTPKKASQKSRTAKKQTYKRSKQNKVSKNK